MARVALALAGVLATATAALPLPPLPHQVRVVPVYSEPLGIRIQVVERFGATNYYIYRAVDGGSSTLLGYLASEGIRSPTGMAEHLDTGVVATSAYTYRLEVCDGSGCTPVPGDNTTSPSVVWPILGGREVMHGFNEVSAWNGIGAAAEVAGYHMGVDLNKTTGADVSTGNVVVAPRGGVVHDIGMPTGATDNWSIAVRVDVGGGRVEFDSFNHIASTGGNAPPVAKGDVVAPGQPIARIGTMNGFRGNFAKHVHFMSERIPTPAGQQRTIRHPLTTFTDPADRDPLGKPPALFDENKDGRVVLFRDHGTRALINYSFAQVPLRGDVDVEPEVIDEQGTDPGQAPIDLGYWIAGPLPDAEQLDDVKSAARPYRLYDFRVEYFGGIPGTSLPTPCNLVSDIRDAANAGCMGLSNCATRPGVACNSAIKEGTTDWGYPVLHHFIVTHAKGETGARADVDQNQFWRTAAKDDNAPVDSAHANYAGQPTTTKAWEARFPDGDYVIHVVASDLVHDKVDLPLRDNLTSPGPAPGIRLENFAPFVKEIVIGQDADGNPATSIPGLTGCEKPVYTYLHQRGQAYPIPAALALARAMAAPTLLRAGAAICARVHLSEPMSNVTVELVRDRGVGPVIATFTGMAAKKHQDNDTWVGTIVPTPDPSGASDSSPVSDEKDVAVRVTAADRRDAANLKRLLDTNGDGSPDAGGDANHLVKLELSAPTKTLDVVKP